LGDFIKVGRMVLKWIIRKLDVACGQDLYAKGRVWWGLMLTE